MSHYRVEVYYRVEQRLAPVQFTRSTHYPASLAGVPSLLGRMLTAARPDSYALVLKVGAFEHDEDVVERWRVTSDGRVLRSRYDVLDTEHEVAPAWATVLTEGARP